METNLSIALLVIRSYMLRTRELFHIPRSFLHTYPMIDSLTATNRAQDLLPRVDKMMANKAFGLKKEKCICEWPYK